MYKNIQYIEKNSVILNTYQHTEKIKYIERNSNYRTEIVKTNPIYSIFYLQ